jgi:uncharacterized protein YkwD
MRRVAVLLCAAAAGCASAAGEPPMMPDSEDGSKVAASTEPDRAGSRSDRIAATCSLPGFRAEALDRLNRHRAAGATCGSRGVFAPVPALSWDDRLARAAARHSHDMASAGFFSHTGSDGSDAGRRVEAAGYSWRAYGENISAGQTGVAAAIDGWMKSPEHCANIMSPRFTQAGLACVPAPASAEYPTYWTLDLGAPM